MSGELPGARATMNELMAQEVAGKPASQRQATEAQVRETMRRYDRNVREGREPPPKRRD